MNKLSLWANQSSNGQILLDFWSEFIGILESFEINENESTVKLIFLSGNFLSIPSNYINHDLEKLIDKKIAVLRTDLREKEYIIRNENKEDIEKN